MDQLRRHLPSLNALFALEATGRCGSFSRASEELNVTPAAVSRMMQRLEEHLGVVLFRRTASGVEMTSAGRRLHEATGRALAGVSEAVCEITAPASDALTLTLSVSSAFTTHWLMPRMGRFKAEFPGVDLRFQLVMGSLAGSVEGVDLGMRFLSEPLPGHRIRPIMREMILSVCSPSYPREEGVAPGTWTLVSLPGAASGLGSPGVSENSHEAVGDHLKINDYSIVVQAALLGQGVSWGWINVVSHWLAHGQLVPFDGHMHGTERVCCLVQFAGHKRRELVDRVADWIVSEMQDDLAAMRLRWPRLSLPIDDLAALQRDLEC